MDKNKKIGPIVAITAVDSAPTSAQPDGLKAMKGTAR
jgi:hypothetical protein